MTRSFLVLALVAILVHPTPAQSCVCEDAWEETVTTLWEGRVLEPLQTDAVSCPELRYMRNIPYARHSFSFGDNWVGKKFVGDPRYQRDEYVTSETVEPMLTPNDRANIKTLMVAEVGMECEDWWKRNGENPAGWNFDNDFESEMEADVPAWQRPEVDVPAWQKPPPDYTMVEIVTLPVMGGSGETVAIVSGEATPQFLIGRALDEKGIENEWLAPLTCTELDRIEDALYARHRVNFELPADPTVGRLIPSLYLTREEAAYYFTSQDKITLLRVNRAQNNKNCEVNE